MTYWPCSRNIQELEGGNISECNSTVFQLSVSALQTLQNSVVSNSSFILPAIVLLRHFVKAQLGGFLCFTWHHRGWQGWRIRFHNGCFTHTCGTCVLLASPHNVSFSKASLHGLGLWSSQARSMLVGFQEAEDRRC